MTIIAIHQPQFLPWLPYFQKMALADIFVYLDDVQYQRRGVQNRNQIKSVSGPIWLTVPVTGSRNTLISDMKIANQEWQKKHVKSIEFNYKKAPYYDIFDELFKPIFQKNHESLVELNIEFCEVFHNFLGLTTECVKASELNCQGYKEEYIINICKELNATTYLSGSGAKDYQKNENFINQGIELEYLHADMPVYSQYHEALGFIEGMSALDIILNIGENVKEYIKYK